MARIGYIILGIFLIVVVLFSFWYIEGKNKPFYQTNKQTNKNIQIKDNYGKSQTNLPEEDHPGIFIQLGNENGISVDIGNGKFLKAKIILELNPIKKM